MTYQEKIAFLRSYRQAVHRQEIIAQEIEELRCQAAWVTQALTGMPGGGDGQALPRAVERIMETQMLLAAEAVRAVNVHDQVKAAIDGVADPLRRDILTRRYILGQRWERIAADNNFTLRRVLQLHRSTVDRMEIA
ncbi:hypothetical protein B5G28_08600 [Faecalibacterium sp. An77]|uniref:hypothetical protein n=1 Tax=Faecalibacterium sp. An77 TaxID=1965655 RepID=UPI000B3861A4|nr:hypothetical protein [Faecalibacterium sp. An77]OUN38643.1 hypothetical protein B5G28_08600 [Faecalibacterium sp. An77]